MHCATMLFLGMVDDATTFAESHGGGGGGSDLKWGRDEDEAPRELPGRVVAVVLARRLQDLDEAFGPIPHPE